MSTIVAITSGTTGAPKPTATRCSYDCCRKKLGLMPLICKCGVGFCAGHFPAEEHKCTYDYRGEAKKNLVAAMPTCQASKVEKL